MKPTGAKFYKCALQVNSYRYNLKFYGTKLKKHQIIKSLLQGIRN
jgi:hypothetical protein